MLKLGARSSPLSRAQVAEVQREYLLFFEPVWVETGGDLDRTTSLREMEKTDFFTRELDLMLLNGEIDLALHSAKDLPDPLPKGLKIALLTEGIDPRDSLVIQKEPVQLVATSSVRREEAVRQIFPECRFVDVRGTIHERLSKEVDGVVIAEAALVRLELTHLYPLFPLRNQGKSRIFLPGTTAPMQGKLAIVCRENEDFIFGAKGKAGDISLSGHPD